MKQTFLLRQNGIWTVSSSTLFMICSIFFVSCHAGNAPVRTHIPTSNKPLTAACSLNPSAVFAGSSDVAFVHVSANDPNDLPLTYNYVATAGSIKGNGPDAVWNMEGTAAGAYKITATIDNGRGETTTCSADIRVETRPNRPPTIACSADRTQVGPGDQVSLTATASDPDINSLTYRYSASAGRIVGNGPSAVFDSTGVAGGNVEIQCSVSNGKGGLASTSIELFVAVPAPAPQSTKMGYCSSLKLNDARVSRVCMALLDDAVLRMKHDSDLKVAICGCASENETNPPGLALARARNAGLYMAQQGVAADRIGLNGNCLAKDQSFELAFVPEGAVYPEGGALQSLLDSTAAQPAKRTTAKPQAVSQVPEAVASQNDVFPGHLAFQPQNPMKVGQTYIMSAEVSAVLSPAQLAAETQQSMAAIVPETARKNAPSATVVSQPIEMTAKMIAHLSGKTDEFSIQADSPEMQDTSLGASTTWLWHVKALKAGKQLGLVLTMSGVDRSGTPHQFNPPITQFIDVTDLAAREKVQNFIGGNWQWLWTAILVPLAAWFWARAKSKKKSVEDTALPPDIGI